MNEPNNYNVGQRIKSIRISHGETMEGFGERFNTSKGTVNNWEKGRNLPNKNNLKAISELGEISVDELLYGSPKSYFFSALPTVNTEDLERLYDFYLLTYEDDPYQSEETILEFYNDLGKPLLENIEDNAMKEASKNVLFAYMYSSYVWLDYLQRNKNDTNKTDLNYNLSYFSHFELKRAIQLYDKSFVLNDEDFENAKERINYILDSNEDFVNIDLDYYFNDDYIEDLLKEED